MDKYDALKLENEICFPFYACSREIIKQYKPLLDKLDLTYTQYITMIALWEKESINVKALGELLFLDSGTLTPLLKKLEAKGLVDRRRSETDERNLIITLTEAGRALRDKAIAVPEEIAKVTNLTAEEAAMLYCLLYKVLITKKN